MSLSYFNVKKLRRQSKQPEPAPESSESNPKVAVTSPPAPTVSTPSAETATSPVLDEEDERFLERLASLEDEMEGTPPPLPERPVVALDSQGHMKVGRDAQEALMDGADKIPLPLSPPEVTAEIKGKGKEKETSGESTKKKGVMDYFALAQSKFKRGEFKDASKDDDKKAKKEKEKEKENKDQKKDKKEKTAFTDKEREQAADDLLAAAKAAKATEADDAEKQAEDLTSILDQLNLSAVNNRVFSFSKESEELMERFKVVLKDLVNGVPTAYNDLEKLLTDSDTKLKDMYGTLPPFLQNLVKSLPAKMSTALAPELLAASAEKPGFDAKQRQAASGGGTRKKSKRARIPSLKNLLSAEGAVATMLRSILNFLKLRFPAVMSGTNVLLSLAVFLLLFVFWYCHKRGREVRLEKEGLAAQEGGSGLASSASSFTDDGDSIKVEASSSKPKDGTGDEKSAEALEAQLPSVANLPEPGSAPPTPAKEKGDPSKGSK